MQAHYSSQNVGHFGLGFKEYAHFTSPIRRYSDLIVHRLLKAINKKDSDEIARILQPINATAIDVSVKERESSAVAMEFIKRKYARWANENIGKEFTAKVTTISDEQPKATLDDSVVGATFHLGQLNENIHLFDEIIVKIERVTLRDAKIFAKFVAKKEVSETL